MAQNEPSVKSIKDVKEIMHNAYGLLQKIFSLFVELGSDSVSQYVLPPDNSGGFKSILKILLNILCTYEPNVTIAF